MKEYEIVWEIFNQCPNNQMRDVFIEEAFLSDPLQYIRQKMGDKTYTLDRTDLEDGTILFDIVASGIRQRYTFSPI